MRAAINIQDARAHFVDGQRLLGRDQRLYYGPYYGPVTITSAPLGPPDMLTVTHVSLALSRQRSGKKSCLGVLFGSSRP